MIDSNNIDNYGLLYSCFSQHVFGTAKTLIKELKAYYRRIPGYRPGCLTSDLLDIIENNEFTDIDVPLLNSVFIKNAKTPEEVNAIMGEIVKYKSYTKQQIAPTKQLLRDIASTMVITKASELYPNPTEYLKFLRTVDLKVEADDVLTTQTLLDLSPEKMVAEQGKTWKTPWNEINGCFRPFLSLPNALYAVSAAPGTGKSLMVQNLALCMAGQGARVHMLILGDLSERDIVCRMASMTKGVPFEESLADLPGSLEFLQQQFGDRISMSILPSGVLTPPEYLEYIKEKPYDVLIIDYDSNFKNEAVTDSMYLAGGELYDSLTQLSKDRLVFVVSQPKVFSWSQEVIGLGDLAESSRKAHIIDALFTISKCPDSNQSVGIIHIAKNRRGRVGDKFPYVRLGNGRFRIIPKGVYDYIKVQPDHKEWMDSEIDQYVMAYNQSYNQIQSQVSAAMQNIQSGGGVTGGQVMNGQPQPQALKGVRNPFGK